MVYLRGSSRRVACRKVEFLPSTVVQSSSSVDEDEAALDPENTSTSIQLG